MGASAYIEGITWQRGSIKKFFLNTLMSALSALPCYKHTKIVLCRRINDVPEYHRVIPKDRQRFATELNWSKFHNVPRFGIIVPGRSLILTPSRAFGEPQSILYYGWTVWKIFTYGGFLFNLKGAFVHPRYIFDPGTQKTCA